MFSVRGRDRAVEHLGVGAVRVLLEEVVLDRPHAVPAELVGEDRLLEGVVERLALAVGVPRSGDRDLVEQRELHGTPRVVRRRVDRASRQIGSSCIPARSVVASSGHVNRRAARCRPMRRPASSTPPRPASAGTASAGRRWPRWPAPPVSPGPGCTATSPTRSRSSARCCCVPTRPSGAQPASTSTRRPLWSIRSSRRCASPAPRHRAISSSA